MRAWLVVLAAALVFAAAGAAAPEWRSEPSLGLARTEVAATVVNGRIAVAGGFLQDGSSSPQVDLYNPASRSWGRLPDLPLGVNHAMATAYRGRLYVVGGYSRRGIVVREAFELVRGRWRQLPKMPEGRAAAGAAVVGGRLYVVGGVSLPGRLAQRALVFDIARRRWSTIVGPQPREHLAAVALGGKVYALAGRLAGIDSNLATLQSYTPGARRWATLPAVPDPRGGTAVAAIGRELVSIGGEAPNGTIASVFAYDVDRRSWRRLPDLPTPRHGLGAVTFNGRVWAISGGERPGLFVSTVVESLSVR
jgi:N-acetylneuraminic acid mutarotase